MPRRNQEECINFHKTITHGKLILKTSTKLNLKVTFASDGQKLLHIIASDGEKFLHIITIPNWEQHLWVEKLELKQKPYPELAESKPIARK